MEFKLLKKNLSIYVFLSLGDDSSIFLLLFSNCHESTHSVLGGFLQYFLALGYKINSKVYYCFFLKNKTRTKKDLIFHYLYIMIISDCWVFFVFVFFLSASLLAKVIESKPTEVLDSVKMFTLFLALQQCSAFIL